MRLRELPKLSKWGCNQLTDGGRGESVLEVTVNLLMCKGDRAEFMNVQFR